MEGNGYRVVELLQELVNVQKETQEELKGIKAEQKATNERLDRVAFEVSTLGVEFKKDREVWHGIITTFDNRFADMTQRLIDALQQVTDRQVRDQLSVPRSRIDKLEKAVVNLEDRLVAVEARG